MILKAGLQALVTLALSTFANSTMVEAATVKSVDEKKRTVTLELGEGETIEKGTEVCIWSESGKKVDCGKVTKVKEGTATLKLKSKKKIKKVTPGLEAKPMDAAEGEATQGEAPEAEEEAGGAGKKGKAAKAYAGKKSPLRIWGLLVPGVAGPMNYNKLVYSGPTSTETPTTLWSSEQTVKTGRFGFALAVGIPVGPFSVNPGFRLMFHQPTVVDSDYVKNVKNPYVTTEEQASEFALFTDFQVFRMPLSKAFSFDFTSGLDIDMSTVTLKAKKKTDNGTAVEGSDTVASATSKLTVLSLRVGSGMDYMFTKVMGAHFGLGLLLPIYESQSFSGKLEAGEEKGLADASGDLKNKLGHKKASFGLDANLGLTLAF